MVLGCHTYISLSSQRTLDMVARGLQPLAEAWGDVELTHTSTYGIRFESVKSSGSDRL